MQLNTIDFYYFSGTGNTLLVIKKMKEIFEENGVKVNLYHLENTNPKDINLNNTVGLGFPVVIQGTYPFVWDFVKLLPKANGTNIFMVDTLAAYSGGVVGPMKRILNNKGYSSIGAKEILMPNNLFPKEINSEENKKKIRTGLEKSERYAKEIINGSSKWGRIYLLSDLMSIFSKSKIIWKFFRWYYPLKVDESKCVKCGLCVKLCPVNNIEMKDYPELKNECMYCMRCISFCPKQAIHIPKKKNKTYIAMKAGELLKGE